MSTLKNLTAAIVSLVLFSTITSAQTVIPTSTYNATSEGDFAVRYLGSDGQYLTFEVKIQSPVAVIGAFKVEDGSEGILYSSHAKDLGNISRVKIEKRDYQALNFKLLIGKKTYSKTFSINTSVIERTTVSESDITKL